MTDKEYTHFTNDGHKTTVCGLEFWMDATDIKTDYRIDCPVCIKLIKQEQIVKELGYEQYQKG